MYLFDLLLNSVFFVFFFIQNNKLEPSLTILKSNAKTYEEKAHDPFHMTGDEKTLPFQFQLGKILY
jgi:hypothetical protein